MCNSVIPNGNCHDTPRQLVGLIGGEDKLVWQARKPFPQWPEGKDWHDLDLCLCGVDLSKTLAKAGLSWKRGADPMQWFIEHDR